MCKKNIKTIGIFLFATILSVFVVLKICHIDSRVKEITKGSKRFSPSNIECYFAPNPDWDVKLSPELISFANTVTHQPYRYLGKGLQAYAFISQDGEYVLKFFQQQRLREKSLSSHFFAYLFSSSFRQKAAAAKHHRDELFTSSKISFEEIGEETGILFVHLNKTENQMKNIRLTDAMGQSHKFNGDTVSFIIQRKADYVFPTFVQLMRQGDLPKAKQRLDQIFDLLLTLAKKGIVDGDYALIRNNNLGFVRERAIYIDTGHLTKKSDLNIAKQMDYEFHSRLQPLHDWMKIQYPELAAYYEARTQEILLSLSPQESAVETIAIKS